MISSISKTLVIILSLGLLISSCSNDSDDLVNPTSTMNMNNGNPSNPTISIEKNAALSSNDSASFNFYNINVITNNLTRNQIEITVTEKDPTSLQSLGQFGSMIVLQLKVLPTSSSTYSHIANNMSDFMDSEYILRSVKFPNENWVSLPNDRHSKQLEVNFENGIATFKVINAKMHDDFINPTLSDQVSISFSIPVSELTDSNFMYFPLAD